ncbi:MAG: ribosomal RNA small subunit methyltransferase A [bacterium]|nr:ribosomal RNA small subunit methyltransferase A [bacterium]
MHILLESLYSKKGMIAYARSRDLHLTKALGQHFIIQREWMASILDKAGLPRSGAVIEIGPGVGHLTWLLLERGLSVTAVEKDRRFAAMLGELAALDPDNAARFNLVRDDAMKVDFKRLREETGALAAVGNLPYNAATAILFHLAYSGAGFGSICGMVQKEVGERILSESGCKVFGRLSIVLQYLYDIEAVEILPPYVFFPVPKVESMFIKMTPKPDADAEFAQLFLERTAQVGFLHRRKKLKHSFRGSVIQKRHLNDEFLERAPESFDFDERAEQWPLERWIGFARYIQSQPPAGE